MEIGVTDFYANQERAEVSDLSAIIGFAEYESSVLLTYFHCFENRNKIFIKFPGRDLGGVFAFLKGFRNDAWVALILLVFSLPTFLFLVYLVLTYFEIYEQEKWSLFHNFLVFVAAIAQQVLNSREISKL